MLEATLLLSLVLPQGDDFAAVQAAQAKRTATVAQVAPAVCAVMPMKSAGGGSGVIIDPLGFVLSNFHVVQRRQKKKKDEDPGDVPDGPKHERHELPKVKPIPLTPELEKKLRAGGFPFEPGKPIPPESFEKMRDYWRKQLDIIPPPRFSPPGVDYDPDNPAWKVMKIGLPDGNLYPADVLGIDPGSDLAILKLRPRPDGKPYPYAKIGNSDALLVGETVFAMGNPFLLATDFTPTVTWGVVSGTHRYQPGGNNRFLVYPDCIQVDAPVNPGNSGGPLFNERGEVVGINGRISVRDRGRVNVGVGFAIASNQIQNFLADMMAGRHSEHGTLDMNAWFMESPGKEERRGVFVQSVFADSVITKMGIKLGDEITRFNDVEVKSANQLASMIGVLPAGSWVKVGYRVRDGNDEFGPEKFGLVQLTALDTGSSRDPDRIASEEHRRLAREAMTREVGVGEEPTTGISLVLQGPKGQRIAMHRLGQNLRYERDGRVLVRTSDEAGFAIDRDGVRDLSAEERALLDRTLRSNPYLWSGPDRKALVADSLLEGGVFTLGRAAYRFRFGGDVPRDVFLYSDGKPAGYRLNDPAFKESFELRIGHEGERVRMIRGDGELEDGWRNVAKPDQVPDAKLFERPAR